MVNLIDLLVVTIVFAITLGRQVLRPVGIVAAAVFVLFWIIVLAAAYHTGNYPVGFPVVGALAVAILLLAHHLTCRRKETKEESDVVHSLRK